MRLGVRRRRRVGARFSLPMFLPGCSLWCGARSTDSDCGSDIQQDSLLDNAHPVSLWEPDHDTRQETPDNIGPERHTDANDGGASGPSPGPLSNLGGPATTIQAMIHSDSGIESRTFFPLWTSPYVPEIATATPYNNDTMSSRHTDSSIQWNLFDEDTDPRIEVEEVVNEDHLPSGSDSCSAAGSLSHSDTDYTDNPLIDSLGSAEGHNVQTVLSDVLFTLDRRLNSVASQQSTNHELRSRIQRLSRSISVNNRPPSDESSPASSGRSRSSTGARQTQQNWYIYDPRLVPGNRAQRLTFETNYGGVANSWSMPGIIEPPPYEEHAAPTDGADASAGASSSFPQTDTPAKLLEFPYGFGASAAAEFPKEPPPPYAYDMPPYDFGEFGYPSDAQEPPPSYREATNNANDIDESGSSLTGISDLMEQPPTDQSFSSSGADAESEPTSDQPGPVIDQNTGATVSTPAFMGLFQSMMDTDTSDATQHQERNSADLPIFMSMFQSRTFEGNNADDSNAAQLELNIEPSEAVIPAFMDIFQGRNNPDGVMTSETFIWPEDHEGEEDNDSISSLGSISLDENNSEYHHRGSQIVESLPSVPTPPDSPTGARGDILVMGRRPPVRWSRGMGLNRWTSSQNWPF